MQAQLNQLGASPNQGGSGPPLRRLQNLQDLEVFKYWENNVCRPHMPAIDIIKRRKVMTSRMTPPIDAKDGEHTAKDEGNEEKDITCNFQVPPSAPEIVTETQSVAVQPDSCADPHTTAPLQTTQVPKRTAHNFDDSDCEPQEEDEADLQEPQALGDPWLDDDPTPDLPPTPWHVEHRGKRLTKKTKPSQTVYSHIIPLGTAFEARARKRLVSEINKDHNESIKAARRAATRTMSRCTGTINDINDNEGNEVVVNFDNEFADNIHLSHEISAVRSNDDTIYCIKCGAYNSGGPLRILKEECSGEVAKCRQYWYKLLQAGIIARSGQRLPASCKRVL